MTKEPTLVFAKLQNYLIANDAVSMEGDEN